MRFIGICVPTDALTSQVAFRFGRLRAYKFIGLLFGPTALFRFSFSNQDLPKRGLIAYMVLSFLFAHVYATVFGPDFDLSN